MSLSNKVFLVSGANRGIGAATVRELLKAGAAKVYAGSRSIESLPDFGDARVVPLQLDVTSDASVSAAANVAGDIDVLINNAGTLGYGDWVNTDLAVVSLDMDTNYFGTLRVIRAFLPHLTARGSGTIANVISIVGLAPVPLLAGYSASKAALQSVTQALRGTLEGTGISVLGIYPGPVDTDAAKGIPLDKVSPDDAAANIVQGIAEGQAYIFPDPMAQQIGQLWSTDSKQLEAAMRVG